MNKCLSAAMAATLRWRPAPASSRPGSSSMRPTPIRRSISARSPATSARQWLLFGSTKDLSCVYLTKDGVSQAYDGKIRSSASMSLHQAGHMVWHVYQPRRPGRRDDQREPRVLAAPA